jgi:hypothetical protein
MKLEVGKVYTFKLNSGEELIAKVTAETTSNYIAISEPVSIAPAQNGMQMIPSMFTADPSVSVTLNTSCVTMYSETEDNIKMKYIEATTGIKLPDKKILVG